MVRKKQGSAKRASIFAPRGKIMMLERNRASGTPLKTPKSSRASVTGQTISPKESPKNKSNATLSKTTTEGRKRRAKPGTKALREIRRFQKSTSLLIPKASFSRVVREIMQQHPRAGDFRFSSLGLMALQEATEMAIVNLLEVANLCCLHARRVTLAPSDIRLTRRAFGLANPVNE